MSDTTGTLAPLIDRIISNPLNFNAARHPEKETSDRPSGYIVLSKKSSKKSKPVESSDGASKESESTEVAAEMKKPRSMYEAVQAYTGKRFLTKAEKRAEKFSKKRKVIEEPVVENKIEDEDLGEDIVDDEGEDLGESSSSEYESASEYPTNSESPTQGEDDDEEEEDDTGMATESDLKDSSESTSEEPEKKDGNVEDSDEDDQDFNSEVHDALESESEESGSESDSDSGSGSDSDSDSESASNSDSVPVNDKAAIVATESNDSEKEDSTPPTSPDDETQSQKEEGNTSPVATIPEVLPLKEFYQINENANDRGSNESTRIYKNWRELIKKKPVGLLNHGVTCYMNSAIQAMLHIPAMQHYLDEVHEGKYNKVLKPRSVSHVLAELSRRMWGLEGEKSNGGNNTRTPKYINPKKLIQRLDDINCMMSEWQQEDSHEYYMSLMSRLQEDSTPKGVKLNQSIIYDIFGGLLHQSVTCKNCGHVSNTKQEFYDLSLGLSKKKSQTPQQDSSQPQPQTSELTNNQKYSIEKSIKDFFSSELIKFDKKDESSGYVCENCQQRTNALKISTIDRAPETLTVHLKRFKFNGNSSSKVKQPVSYPNTLDLTQFSSDNSPTKYQLTSVIVHEGRSISSGHYVAHCLQPDGSWANYDDEYINKVGEREALKDPSAYFLVYTRLTHKSIPINEVGKKRKLEKSTTKSNKKSKK
ncbi:ubiquitin carboxyl-terminal hydrolase 10 [[Candida] anglica]|uniref:ubiquitinyl hydrolase 1 n=1 Tax=[Candida] anglica TaxID=148631 RepID=A0ABP0E8I3_9ASCO